MLFNDYIIDSLTNTLVIFINSHLIPSHLVCSTRKTEQSSIYAAAAALKLLMLLQDFQRIPIIRVPSVRGTP